MKSDNVTFLPWVEPTKVPPTAGHNETDDDLETDLLRALTRRDMSTQEVRTWLNKRGVASEQVEEWLDRLTRLGYVNDARMAEHVVESLRRRGGKGRQAVLRALTDRGIDRVTAQGALEVLDTATEIDMATELVAQRLQRSREADVATMTRRLEGFLARRGFSSQAIREAIRVNLSPRV